MNLFIIFIISSSQIIKHKSLSNDKYWLPLNKRVQKIVKHLDCSPNISNPPLNKTDPLKQKYSTANNNLFMNKIILRTITKETRLRNTF